MNKNDEQELIERQENEIYALKSIYGENCVDLRNLAIDTKTPTQNRKRTISTLTTATSNITTTDEQQQTKEFNPYLKITVYPSNSGSCSQYERIKNYVQVDLTLKCSILYPNEAPKIKLENAKSLNKAQIKELHKKLTEKANELIGNEMVYELVTLISYYLYDNCKPPPENDTSDGQAIAKIETQQSLHDQMLERLKTADNYSSDEEYFNNIDARNNDELVEAMKEKQKKLQEEIKKERMASKRERLSSSNYSVSVKSSESCSTTDDVVINTSPLTSSIAKNEKFTQFKIEFNQPNKRIVQCIKLIDSQNDTRPYKIYRAFDLNTSDLLNVYEWSILLDKTKILQKDKLESCINDVSKIMEEFKKLIKLKNESLVNYIAYNYQKHAEKNLFLIQICMSYIEGTCLDVFIKQKHVLSLNTLKSYATELINTLEFIHSKDVYHRDLKASCIFLDSNGNLKVSDYSIVKRINNVYDKYTNEANTFLNANKSSDYHQFGLMLLSLALGELIDSYDKLRIPQTLPSDFKDFVYSCIYGNNFDSIRNHEFLLNQSSPRDVKMIETRERNSISFENFGCKKFNDYPSQSRLNTEFEVVGVVGEGAFGKVLKAKNNLDMRYYAIKRIRINPNSNQLNKITREIKLLSRLNHENIVRYFSTWVETSEENIITKSKNLNDSISTSATTNNTTSNLTNKTKSSKLNKQNSSSLEDLLRNKSPFFVCNEVDQDDFSSFSSSASSSFSNHRDTHNDVLSTSSSSSSSDDDNEKGITKNVKHANDSDDCVVFENEDGELNESSSDESDEEDDDDDEEDSLNNNQMTPNKIRRQFIYIQMEFCNGNTLKHLIDNKRLFERQDQIWRLLREILQGLNHIHEQGMIHRDLKPTNVLIDDLGHAKIGDFGLATSKCFLQGDNQQAQNTNNINTAQNQLSPNSTNGNDNSQYDSHLTGTVGTSYYVAPELLTPSNYNRYLYTQKVDIYSLGIMFYEMCFELKTQMERDLVMVNLRKVDIQFPQFEQDFYKQHESQILLINEMLKHNPDDRPSAKQLLNNELIPRKADEIVLDKLLKYSLSKNNSTSYQKIIKAVFDQINSDKEDASYDSSNINHLNHHKTKLDLFKYLQTREYIHNILTRLFQKCGAFMLNYPLLMPWNKLCNDFNRAFQLVDNSGLVLTLPYNHRVQFARYIARSDCDNIKRYFIGNVYECYLDKLKLSGFHPKEKIEASFDIVTTTNSDFLPEVEIIYLLNELILSIPELVDHEFRLVINHTKLLNSLLLHCGVKNELHKEIYLILSEYSKQTKSQIAPKDNAKNWLSEKLSLTIEDPNSINKLLNWLLKEGPVEKLLSDMKILTKNTKNAEVVKLAKESLNQIKLLTQYLQVFDLKFTINLSASLVLPLMYHPYEHDGLIYQLLIKRKAKKTRFDYDLIASGGRYDKLVKYFCIKNEFKKRAIGVSIDFDKLVGLVNEKMANKTCRNDSIIFSHASSVANSQQTSFENDQLPSLNLDLHENLNRLCLFKYLSVLNTHNPFLNIYLVHERFTSTDEMDSYCKNHSISSYVYINDDGYSSITHKLFLNYLQPQRQPSRSNEILASSSHNKTCLKIRSINDKLKFNEKSFSLNEFLFNLNQIIQNHKTFLLNFNPQVPLTPLKTISSTNSISPTTNNTTVTTSLDSICSTILSYSPNQTQSTQLPIINNTNQSSLNNWSQLNITILQDSQRQQSTSISNNVGSSGGGSSSNANINRIIARLTHLFSIFSSRTRIEIIVIDSPDLVIQTLGTYINIDCDEKTLHQYFTKCYDKLIKKYEKQLINYRLEDILKDLRFIKKSKVFILCSLNGEYYKLLVAP